jgi:hypothetical protein
VSSAANCCFSNGTPGGSGAARSDGAAERAADAVDHALPREVLILREVVDDAL